jgi:putative PEP-CTERM system integral membrane protein
MQAHAAQVKSVLQKLFEMDNLELPVDVYLTASPYRGEEPSLVSLDSLDLDQILYFGGQNAAQLIAQFEALRHTNGDRQYDAVVLLTDGSGYELGESYIEVPVPPNPVWVVHLGGEIPLGYDDQTLEAIQVSGGGVAGDLDEALARLAVSLASPAAGQAVISDLVDGYLWTVLPTGKATTAIPNDIQIQQHAADEPITALAARRLVLAEMQRNRGTIDQLETLDALHALAMDYEIVTPYSSMIVLVAGDQLLLLEQLSELDDRYQREIEDLGDTTTSSPLPLTGVPEPHEWLLLFLAAALLIYLAYTKRTRLSWRGSSRLL